MLETAISTGVMIIILQVIVIIVIALFKIVKQPSTARDWAPAIAASHRPTSAQVQQNYQRPAPQQPAARPTPPPTPVQQTVVNVAPVPPAAPPAAPPDLLDRPSLADNYYAVLNIDHDADEATIKSAYRSLMRQWHPDTCKLAGADDEVRAINEAYEVLSDDDERQRYDAGLWLQDEVK